MRKKVPDARQAHSLLEAARRDMEFTLTLPVTAASRPTIVRNIYECFRMVGEALLLNKGTVSSDHVLPIQEVTMLDIVTSRPLRLIENLRTLRHTINYDGYAPTENETKDAVSLAESCFFPACKKAEEIVRK